MIVSVGTVILLIAGVGLTLVARGPGALCSLLAVYAYWWSTDYSEPTTVTVALLTLMGLLAASGWVLGPFIEKRFDGPSPVTASIAGLAGIVGFVFLGTVGLLLGVVLTVVFLVYLRHRNVKQGLVAAAVVIIGTLTSRVVAVILTAGMLLVMLTVLL